MNPVAAGTEDTSGFRTCIATKGIEVTLLEGLIKAVYGVEIRKVGKSQAIGTCADNMTIPGVEVLLHKVVLAAQERIELPEGKRLIRFQAEV